MTEQPTQRQDHRPAHPPVPPGSKDFLFRGGRVEYRFPIRDGFQWWPIMDMDFYGDNIDGMRSIIANAAIVEWSERLIKAKKLYDEWGGWTSSRMTATSYKRLAGFSVIYRKRIMDWLAWRDGNWKPGGEVDGEA